MSVKHAMLALLAAQPASTYQLRKRFDASTGQSLPLNIGQVSTTLQRMERDRLVVRDESDRDDEGGARPWRLTDEGRAALAEWWSRPVLPEERGRDELVMKVALAAITPGVDVAEMVQSQRAATQRLMHDLTRLRRGAEDLAGRLILDRHLFNAEAELRWLDDVEIALERRATGEAEGAADPHPAASVAAAQRPRTNARSAR